MARTSGSETSAVTLDGIPANVLPPSVTALDSTSLSISWQEPLSPNGEIVLYTIFVNSLPILNATMPDVFLHTGLRPFTNYTVRLQACTTFGCDISDLVLTATLEGAPSSLAPPRVNVTGSTSADISWGLCSVNSFRIKCYNCVYRASTATQWYHYRISSLSTNASTVSI